MELWKAKTILEHGNAPVMLGTYRDAIESYHPALQQPPDWTEAKIKRTVAAVRAGHAG